MSHEDEIAETAVDPEYSVLIIDVVAHPDGMVAERQFSILNPSLSEQQISTLLAELEDAKVISTKEATDNSGTIRTYYQLTSEARNAFECHNLFAPEPLEELFRWISHKIEFKRLSQDEPN
jgi:DNA-binding PadR family transcriptional regulator